MKKIMLMLIFSMVVLVSCAVTESQEDNYYRIIRGNNFDVANQLSTYTVYQYADGNVRSDSYNNNGKLLAYDILLFNSSGRLIAESNYTAVGILIDFNILKYDLNNRFIVRESYDANGEMISYDSNEYYDSRRVMVFYTDGVASSSNVFELRTNSNQPLKMDNCSGSCTTEITFEYDSANRLTKESYPNTGNYYIYEYSTTSDNPGYIRRNRYSSNGVLGDYGTFEYETYFSPTVPPRSIFRGIRF